MGLGFQGFMKDLGHEIPLRVWTDSSAAIGICSRQGLGKLRHIDTHLLWIQQAVRSKRVDLRKILGEENPADLFTKHLSSRDRVQKLVSLMGCRYTDGRAASAPLRRQGAQGRTTMAEANVVTEEDDSKYNPVMPHLKYRNRAQMDERHPPLEATEDVEHFENDDPDKQDEVYQTGLTIIEDIRGHMLSDGRRRIQRV